MNKNSFGHLIDSVSNFFLSSKCKMPRKNSFGFIPCGPKVPIPFIGAICATTIAIIVAVLYFHGDKIKAMLPGCKCDNFAGGPCYGNQPRKRVFDSGKNCKKTRKKYCLLESDDYYPTYYDCVNQIASMGMA